MMRIKISAFIAILLLVSGFALPAKGIILPQTEDVPTVAFSMLIKYPERYDQKRVRLHAVYERALVDSFLYDVFLVERKGAKGVASHKFLLQIDEDNWDKVVDETRREFPTGQCDKAEVEVIGTFNIRKSTYPYGDSVKYSFVVSEFKQAKCLPEKS